MNTLTHLVISQIVQKNIEEDGAIRLNRIGFMYGNIKPDISTSLIKIPHFKDGSFDFIKKEIRELMNYKITGVGKCTRHFSEKLGVITHYLSDYFCYAHSNQFSGRMVDHHIYEAKLSQYCKQNLSFMKTFKFSKTLEITNDYKSLCNYIDEFHIKYSKSVRSFESDMMFTLKICISICLSILFYIGKKAETAA